MQVRAYHREWNRTRRDKERQHAYNSDWYQRHKDTRTVNQNHIRNWYKNNPFAMVAHGRVRRALAVGGITKSAFCEDCKVTEKRLVAHHEDYAKPLDVVWLCDRCHKRRHSGVV